MCTSHPPSAQGAQKACQPQVQLPWLWPRCPRNDSPSTNSLTSGPQASSCLSPTGALRGEMGGVSWGLTSGQTRLGLIPQGGPLRCVVVGAGCPGTTNRGPPQSQISHSAQVCMALTASRGSRPGSHLQDFTCPHHRSKEHNERFPVSFLCSWSRSFSGFLLALFGGSFCFSFLRQSLDRQLRLFLNLLCNPGWPQTLSDPLASASCGRRL